MNKNHQAESKKLQNDMMERTTDSNNLIELNCLTQILTAMSLPAISQYSYPLPQVSLCVSLSPSMPNGFLSSE